MPRKIALYCETRQHRAQPRSQMLRTWFIPALANSSVGSSYGMVDDEGTYVWFLDLKKLKNSSRTLLAAHVDVEDAILVKRRGDESR